MAIGLGAVVSFIIFQVLQITNYIEGGKIQKAPLKYRIFIVFGET